EVTQSRLPEAHVVKAFNTIWFKHFGEHARPDLPADQRHAIPVASDDAKAKRVVMDLIDQIGFGPVDSGSLAAGGRRQQPTGPLYNTGTTVAEMRAALTTR